jgi:hypothetical protein
MIVMRSCERVAAWFEVDLVTRTRAPIVTVRAPNDGAMHTKLHSRGATGGIALAFPPVAIQ